MKMRIFAFMALIAVSQAFMPGAGKIMSQAEIKSDEILQGLLVSSELADTYNKMSNNLYAHQLSDVIRVTKKIVAGIEYDILIKMQPTECKKNVDKYLKKDLQNCKMNANGKAQKCTFNVWFRSWMILGAPAPSIITLKKCQ